MPNRAFPRVAFSVGGVENLRAIVQIYPFSFVSSLSYDAVEGSATLVDPSKREARLAVTFPGNRFSRPPPPEGNYLVLDTDYTGYAIVWSCESLPGRSFSQFIALDFYRRARFFITVDVFFFQDSCGT